MGDVTVSTGPAELIRLFMEVHHQREWEMEALMRMMRDQMELMAWMVVQLRERVPQLPTIHLTRTSFGRQNNCYRWHRSLSLRWWKPTTLTRPMHWVNWIALWLTGKVQQAYVALPMEAIGECDALKVAILQRYSINEEAYWHHLRTYTWKRDESYPELAIWLLDLLAKWMKECKTV